MADMLVTRRRLTRNDYRALPEGPPYFELLDGELIEMTRPTEDHNEIAQILVEWWRAHIRAKAGGALSFEPNLYLPDTDDVCHPDLAYLTAARLSIRRKDGIYGTPDVICEILSPTTAHVDRGRKRDDYRRAGVRHLWLVTPERPVMVEEFILTGEGDYRLQTTAVAPAEWEPAAFPGWRLALAELDAAIGPVDEHGPG
jgi:Uma2 family endonuclease